MTTRQTLCPICSRRFQPAKKNAGKSAPKARNFCVKNLLLNKLFRINYSWLGCRISTKQDTLTDREKEAAQKKLQRKCDEIKMKIYTDNVFCLARKKSFCTFRETLLKHWNLLTHPVVGGGISAKWKYFISDEIEKCKWEFLMEIPMEVSLVGFRRWATAKKNPEFESSYSIFCNSDFTGSLFAFRNRNRITSLAHIGE